MKKVFTSRRRKDEPRGCTLRDKNLKTLHRAASVGDLEKVKEYLQLKEHDVNTRDRDLRTPLHLACANGYSNTVSLLTEKQCKVNVWDGENRSPLTKDGYTPLLLAIAENTAEMVEFLLKSEADVNASDKNQRTALMIALSDEPSLVNILLQQEVDLSCQDIMDSQLRNMHLSMVLLYIIN
ncbi:LOW QUALITY PROTEIN: ankyrin repeat domain-containing protein 7-like [Odocoileus virginianus]|uniref:LOW QUALITY PROTEIN: ankyrin repeat domain-containing protein 7-like n=1 Tax=Odocoileus virginianus TaxID=9874 RepID=A0ABM4HBU6_ODOVR